MRLGATMVCHQRRRRDQTAGPVQAALGAVTPRKSEGSPFLSSAAKRIPRKSEESPLMPMVALVVGPMVPT